LVTAKLFLLKSNVPYCQLFTITEINISLFWVFSKTIFLPFLFFACLEMY
jgi:hypothetical protein